MKTALLYNYKAGKGLPAELVVRKLCDFFAGDEILVSDPGLVFPELPVSLVEPEPADGYFAVILARVKALAEATTVASGYLVRNTSMLAEWSGSMCWTTR